MRRSGRIFDKSTGRSGDELHSQKASWRVSHRNFLTEAHRAEIIFIFRTTNKFGNVFNGLFFQHFQRPSLAPPPCAGPPTTCCDTGKRVRTRRASGTHGGGRGVLFMVSVQDQNTVHSTFQNRINFIRFARRGEHHIQEVTGIGEIVARINKW